MNEENTSMNRASHTYDRYEGQADNPTAIQYYTQLYCSLADLLPQLPENITVSTNTAALHRAWRKVGIEPFYWVDDHADEAIRRKVLKSLIVVYNNDDITLPTLQERREEHRHNIFIYPEFSGIKGQALMKHILKKILKYHMYHGWHSLYLHHSAAPMPPNEFFYMHDIISLQRAEIVIKGTSMLEQQGLLHKESGPDGIRSVDFSQLYHLAHEYFLWTESVEYKFFLPAIKAVARIHHYPDIYLFVMRFENYRRILNSKKARDLRLSGAITIHTW
jgi:hypothetical protein